MPEAHRKAIGDALRGMIRPRLLRQGCRNCGKRFLAGTNRAKYCGKKCARSVRGHGIVHSQAYAKYPRLCGICYTTKNLVGDHDHKTGLPRGVLCRNCNMGVGNLRDDPKTLRAAADYLEQGEATIYISGPMSNCNGFNYAAFHKAAATFRSLGYRVISPAEGATVGLPWEDYMKQGIQQLIQAGRVAMLCGWEQSKGATLEHHIAQMLDLPIYHYYSSDRITPEFVVVPAL